MRWGTSLGLMLLIGACASVSKTELMSITPGQTREEVVALLGTPGARSFRGEAEALTYCNGVEFSAHDDYKTIWLLQGRVVALTSSNGGASILDCSAYPEIDWGQAPPDVRIAIELHQ